MKTFMLQMIITCLTVLALNNQLFATDQIVSTNSDAGAGSLRQAIADVTDGGTITFNLSTPNETIVLLTELLITGKGVSINGANTAGSGTQITVQVTTPGTSPYRVFHVNALDKTCNISNMYIKGGFFVGTGGTGGGIYCEQGILNLSHITVSDSKAANGGGINMAAPATSTFDWVTITNCVGSIGGGLYCEVGNILILNNCLFTGNTLMDPPASKAPNSGGGSGGGICNLGTMTVNNCEISDNHGGGNYQLTGLGLCNKGNIQINHSVIKNNTYSGTLGITGGGITSNKGTFVMMNSTISGNVINTSGSSAFGAGIAFFGSGLTGSITNCTISENSTTGPSYAFGGGICNLGAALTITNTTIANNTASGEGAGVYVTNNGTLAFKNSILAQNTDNSIKFDFVGSTVMGSYTLTDNSNNIVQYQNVSADAGNSFNAATDLLFNTSYNAPGTDFTSWTKGGDANGGSLNLASAVAANGGPTETLAITPGSIAIHSGSWDAAVTLDQRGTNRHEGSPAIGAFELRPAPGYFYTTDPPPSWDDEGNWEDGHVPGATDNVTISPNATFNPRIYSSAVCNDLNIPAGMNVTVYPGYSLTVNGTLVNNNGNSGVVIGSNVLGDGSLIHQTANVPGTVERYIPGASRAWHFLSSPVANQPISPEFTAALPADYDFFTWYETDGLWVNFKNTTIDPTWETVNGDNNFAPGTGYLVEYEKTGLVKQFAGNLNSGAIGFRLSRAGTGAYARYNLAGNPYPSAIDWKASSGWQRLNLEPDGGGYTMSIWNSADGNYGAFNSTGSSGTHGVTRYIAVGQGFMVKATAVKNGDSPGKAPLKFGIIMDDGVRVNNSQPYMKTADAIDNILRLKVTGEVNTYSDEIVVEFGHPTANGGAEKRFSFYETAPSLYIVKPEGNYSIDFRGEPGAVTIPVSFKAGADGNYTITASQLESFTSSAAITLEDLKLSKTQNLRQNPVYAFPATTTDAEARFLLHFGGTYSVDDLGNRQPFNVYASGSSVYIANHSGVMLKGEVIVYNMIGQPMLRQPLGENALTKISLSGCTGYYLVKVLTGENVYSVKVFIN